MEMWVGLMKHSSPSDPVRLAPGGIRITQRVVINIAGKSREENRFPYLRNAVR